jgi:hypothetical protein
MPPEQVKLIKTTEAIGHNVAGENVRATRAKIREASTRKSANLFL